MKLDARVIANSMGGDVNGDSALVPGPGHSPKDRSLSVKPNPGAKDGFIVHSFAGDDFALCRDHVKSGLGREPHRKANGSGTAELRRRIVASYPYQDERGDLLFEVVRLDPKDFRQRRPDGHGGWIYKLGDIVRVPYRLPELIEAISNGYFIAIPEGEKDADALRGIGINATTGAGGAGKWRHEYRTYFGGASVVILPDNDDVGRDHARQVAEALTGIADRIRVLDIGKEWPQCPPKGDISDWLAAGGTREQLDQLIDAAPDGDAWIASLHTKEIVSPREPSSPEKKPRLKPLDLQELFELKIKPREMLLKPIIPEKGLAMLYASRGTGKTHIALGIAYAVATGTAFLKWSAPKTRRVLLVDGEMPAAALRERLEQITAGAALKPGATMLQVLAGDLIEDGGVGNLSDPKLQAEFEPLLDGVELLILDNLSSLTAVIRDNDAESWNPIQAWLLKLRRRGISFLIVHHAGKGGEQRGTSRREDILDTSISLRRPSDYVAIEGARFEVHLVKGRGIHGEDAKPFEARLEMLGNAQVWTTRAIEDVNRARVAALLDDGLSVRDIAEETGLSKSVVGRLKKAIEAEKGNPNE